MIGGGVEVRRLRGLPRAGIPMTIEGAEVARLPLFWKSFLDLYFVPARFAGPLLSPIDAMLQWIDACKDLNARPRTS
eukprot:5400876-Pyramimonas_sp.AAC.1